MEVMRTVALKLNLHLQIPTVYLCVQFPRGVYLIQLDVKENLSMAFSSVLPNVMFENDCLVIVSFILRFTLFYSY
jgi:hypothetical protein